MCPNIEFWKALPNLVKVQLANSHVFHPCAFTQINACIKKELKPTHAYPQNISVTPATAHIHAKTERSPEIRAGVGRREQCKVKNKRAEG